MIEPRTIALCSNTSWSLYNFRLGLIRSFIGHGLKVYVIAPRDTFTAKLIAEGAIYIPIQMSNHGSNPISDLGLFWQLFKIYKKHSFDTILHYTPKPNIYGSFAAHLAKVESISIFTGLGRVFQLKGNKQRIIILLLKRMVAVSKEIWFLNSDNEKVFFEKIGGERPKRNTYILKSEGINLRRFSKKIPNGSKPFVRILFAGRLLMDKGVIEFVEAAKIIKKEWPQTKFELLGMIDHDNDQGISLNTIQDWQSMGYIRYLGSTEDVRMYLDRSDLLVFPSYYQEGLSRILLEAASMELPIVTTRQTGCKEVVIDEVTGLLCEPKSVEDLVAKIRIILLKSEEERWVMGQKAREYVRINFNENDVIEAYFERLNLYKTYPINSSKSE